MMSDRGITYVCSSCGATFPTRTALADHIAAGHGRHSPAIDPKHDLVEPSGSAVPSEAPAMEPRQPDADLALQSETEATAVAPGEMPTATPTPQPHRPIPTSAHRTLLCVAVAVICIAAAAGLGIAFPHQIAHQIALAVTRQPEPFTEL